MIELLKEDWKEEINPIFDLFVDRAPGSFVEEKRENTYCYHCGELLIRRYGFQILENKIRGVRP
ncbi:hypothetical protein CW713_02680 [Methanophagales archaeon]|nr:MAG: hypothetical protein CW713_02680 [Methanophagales archaeon]